MVMTMTKLLFEILCLRGGDCYSRCGKSIKLHKHSCKVTMMSHASKQSFNLTSGGIKGGGGTGAFAPPPPHRRLYPHFPPVRKEKNGPNWPFLAIFFYFPPSEMHFSPSMPPTKNFLVPPLNLKSTILLCPKEMTRQYGPFRTCSRATVPPLIHTQE